MHALRYMLIILNLNELSMVIIFNEYSIAKYLHSVCLQLFWLQENELLRQQLASATSMHSNGSAHITTPRCKSILVLFFFKLRNTLVCSCI